MIFGSIAAASAAGIGHEGVLRALEYAAAHDLAALGRGRHDIDGDALYVNRAGYDTRPRAECAFEAHRRYIDVHVVIAGEECIDSAHVGTLAAGPYDAQGDSMALDGEASASCIVRPGDFAAYFPDDAHKPGIMLDAPTAVEKAVFKVALD